MGRSFRVRSQQVSSCLILRACCRERGPERCRQSYLCSFISTLLASSRYLMRLSMMVGSSCQQAQLRESWMFLRWEKQEGAHPKASIQSQAQQAKKVNRLRSLYLICLPFLFRESMLSATQSSYRQVEQEPKKKAMAVKSSPKSPPTQESTVSNLPSVRVTVRLRVDLQRFILTYLVEWRETALVWQLWMQLPVSLSYELVGHTLLSVFRVHSPMSTCPTEPMVVVKDMKIFFSRNLVTAIVLEGVRMVSIRQNLTWKQSLLVWQEVMQLLMFEGVSHEASSAVSQEWMIKEANLYIVEPSQPESVIDEPLSMHSIWLKPRIENWVEKSSPRLLQSLAVHGERGTLVLVVVGVPEPELASMLV